MLRSSASRSAWATISTAPLSASCVTTVTRPPPLVKFSASRSSMSGSVRNGSRCYACQQAACFAGEHTIRRDGASAECGAGAVPVGERAASLLDDGLQRSGVPRRQHGVAHYLGTPRRDEKVSEAITPRAAHGGRAGERPPSRRPVRSLAESL